MLLDTARAGLKLAILIPLHFNLAQRKILVTKLGLLYISKLPNKMFNV